MALLDRFDDCLFREKFYCSEDLRICGEPLASLGPCSAMRRVWVSDYVRSDWRCAIIQLACVSPISDRCHGAYIGPVPNHSNGRDEFYSRAVSWAGFRLRGRVDVSLTPPKSTCAKGRAGRN